MTGDHAQIYRFVERHGAVTPEIIQQHLEMGGPRFARLVTDLRQAGYLHEVAGILSVTSKPGLEETGSVQGLEYAIRPARDGDAPQLTALLRRFKNADEFCMTRSSTDPPPDAMDPTPASTPSMYVVMVDEQVIGWILYEQRQARGDGRAAQQTLGVIDAYRGSGLLDRLIERGFEWAADQGFSQLDTCLPGVEHESVRLPESDEWDSTVIPDDQIAINPGYIAEIERTMDPTDAKNRTEETTASMPDKQPGNEYVVHLTNHLEHALRATDVSEARFHIRHSLQYQERLLETADAGSEEPNRGQSVFSR